MESWKHTVEGLTCEEYCRAQVVHASTAESHLGQVGAEIPRRTYQYVCRLQSR